jgi:thiol-disulfide isomerase/thioredoxin
MIAPMFHKASENEDFKNLSFEEIDVDDEEKEDFIAEMKVRNVPTIIVIDENGKELGRKVGAIPEKELNDFLKEYV